MLDRIKNRCASAESSQQSSAGNFLYAHIAGQRIERLVRNGLIAVEYTHCISKLRSDGKIAGAVSRQTCVRLIILQGVVVNTAGFAYRDFDSGFGRTNSNHDETTVRSNIEAFVCECLSNTLNTMIDGL